MSNAIFSQLARVVEEAEVPFNIHSHEAARTVADAEHNLAIDVARIVKAVAFRTRTGITLLAALRGTRRVDYARLAALVGVNRRDLAVLSPDEVRELLGVEPGSVSPLLLGDNIVVYVDEDVLTILPTIYCGIGRPDRTLEMTAADLVKLARGRVGSFSR